MKSLLLYCVTVICLLASFIFGKAEGIPTKEPNNPTSNNRPVIAVLSQRMSPSLLPPGTTGDSYIAASYVKYLESAGARVVPVIRTMSKEDVEEIFNSVNGVLFPGGGATMFASPYFTNAERFYNLAVEANKRGDFFPIWGTCLGFEALTSITAGKPILSQASAVDITIPLNFSSEAKNSRMLKNAPESLLQKLGAEGLTYNFHHKCVTPETFSANPKLKDTYRVLSFNDDVYGKTFISTIEGKELPFYATQWHPEKNSFEWCEERNIAHSRDAVKATQYFADFFVNEARKSEHRFKSRQLENKYLIYRYDPIYTGAAGHFEQCYIF